MGERHGQRSKANALNKRATYAADALDYWAKRLRKEANAQTPPRTEPATGVRKYMPDELPQTITLQRVDIELLIEKMRVHAREFRQFTWPALL